MARNVKAFVDNKGNLHLTLNGAVVADLAQMLGRVGDDGGMTEGVARLIIARREEIEKAFSDLDKLGSKAPVDVPVSEAEVAEIIDINGPKNRSGAA